ncbi:DUF6279 family lipoprotein [Neptunicella marina]|uniref:Lipoprotein n=1 Tax=Neptunicella marina TaxID=2125989 RepID=A0A8J6LVH9_9ALTE|nr:DUF6279 family lipoprotein [Neptunicella marina]MBC3764589.1 hypothetical protein [Neptunicella marina]
MRRWAGILGLLLLVTGCSSKFAYNNLDWISYWYIDDYIDLSRLQKQQVDKKLNLWLSWHRKEELARYKQQLETLKSLRYQGPLTAGQWLEQFEQGREHWYRFRDRVIPDLVSLAHLISDEQVDSIFAELDKQNNKSIKRRQDKSANEKLEERIEDTRENIEEFVGHLNAKQLDMIQQAAPQFNSAFKAWIAYRQAFQQACKEMLLQREKMADFDQQFLHLLGHPEEFQDQSFISLVEQNRMLYARLVADIDQTLTPAQVAKLNRELDDLIEDLDDLIQH